MRQLFIVVILFFCYNVYADAKFDSLYWDSDEVVLGTIVRHEMSAEVGFAHPLCLFDFRVYAVYGGARMTYAPTARIKPGDTLRNLKYYGADGQSCLDFHMEYVLPLKVDSGSNDWKLVNPDCARGVCNSSQITERLCPVKEFIWYNDTLAKNVHTQKISYHGKWRTIELFGPNGQLLVRKSVDTISGFTKYIERDSVGTIEMQNRSHFRRVRGRRRDRGQEKLIIWQLRKAGKISIDRQVYYVGRVFE